MPFPNNSATYDLRNFGNTADAISAKIENRSDETDAASVDSPLFCNLDKNGSAEDSTLNNHNLPLTESSVPTYFEDEDPERTPERWWKRRQCQGLTGFS
ncbi:hypothetical protein H6F50_16790 [Coleofasciculus sp. FACHB-712]|uniref:hypothetical protein n=1 Tax=Coleofasciculus sp. FACHB-712 TaxID=2692789 RepID=UPI0016875365|nr:hypothetical protein [Coleofasciculus sp. FACHB-712]MBD1943998.1 hypothetical protein [Coleofasciculus sp. FACHB-712]